MKLYKEIINYHDLLRFYEWSKSETEKHIAGTNMPLVTKLRRDTLSCSPHSDERIEANKFGTLTVFVFSNFNIQSAIYSFLLIQESWFRLAIYAYPKM